MEAHPVHVRIPAAAFAALLLVAGAVGLLGAWALALGVVLLVGTSVVTVIVWEEREVEAAPAFPPDRVDELVAAHIAGR